MPFLEMIVGWTIVGLVCTFMYKTYEQDRKAGRDSINPITGKYFNDRRWHESYYEVCRIGDDVILLSKTSILPNFDGQLNDPLA